MPDSHVHYKTKVDECAKCGKSYDQGTKGYVFKARKLDPNESKDVWCSTCPYCSHQNETPLVPKSGQRVTIGNPKIPKARSRKLGQSWNRVKRDKWVSIPPDLEQVLEEERRLRDAKATESSPEKGSDENEP